MYYKAKGKYFHWKHRKGLGGTKETILLLDINQSSPGRKSVNSCFACSSCTAPNLSGYSIISLSAVECWCSTHKDSAVTSKQDPGYYCQTINHQMQ